MTAIMNLPIPIARRLASLILVFGVLFVSLPAAADFLVEDIHVEGAQNIEVGTIFNYLPLKVGDVADSVLIDESIKTLFATGFFQDVEIRRQNNILVVVVSERPAISGVEYSGNKDVDDETIETALAQIGVAEGRVFREPLLGQLVQAIEEQYFAKGRYSAKVDAVVTPVDRNRVAISLAIDEGRVARIREINIVGNEAFTDKELLSEISLGEEAWHSFVSQIGRYSKEELRADAEILRSFYLNRGYMNIDLLSSDVTISQNMQDIFTPWKQGICQQLSGKLHNSQQTASFQHPKFGLQATHLLQKNRLSSVLFGFDDHCLSTGSFPCLTSFGKIDRSSPSDTLHHLNCP